MDEVVPFLSVVHAQDREDVFAYENFFWKRERSTVRPIILESGALDGVLFSTSFAFEQALGWRSIHIEAGPANYELLIQNRPLALNIHTALCANPTTLHFLQHFSKDPVAGIYEFMSPTFKTKFWPDIAVEDNSVAADPRSTPISCTPLATLLDRFHVPRHIDLWVLDVEGAELSVLQTVDLSAVHIDVIVVELDGSNEVKDDKVIAHLTSKGYAVTARTVSSEGLPRNTWFVRTAARGLRHKPGIIVQKALEACFLP